TKPETSSNCEMISESRRAYDSPNQTSAPEAERAGRQAGTDE
ncbi:hypothetical protein Pmani_034215, partial [Petrolisthes manimaculis]